MNTFVVDGATFARAAWNALQFTPPRSPIPAALLCLSPSEVYFLATDTYAIGRPSLGAVSAIKGPMRMELTRADLSALDKAGRACKGDMRVTAGPDGVMVEGVQQQVYEAIPDRASTLKYDRAIWDLCRDLLVKLDRSEPAIPEHVAVDPSLLARFGKIKTPQGTSPLLDMAITSANEPILIRCGPDFRGALMPVDRAVARGAKTRGGDFLW